MVAREDRFTRAHPCPVCDGYDSDRRGISRRCFGFQSEDGEWIHCTREEFAGGCIYSENSQTYAHWAQGLCPCGRVHDEPAEPCQRSALTSLAKSPTRQQKLSRPFTVPPDSIEDDYKLTRWYVYRNEHGEQHQWTFRYECTNDDGSKSKTFKQARVNAEGKGEWCLGKDFRRVLYMLPELLKADPTKPVYIVEGEKDVDRLRDLGLVATSSPEGAGKWDQVKDAALWLRDRAVIIIEDNDLPGQKHTAQIRASLEGVARSLEVIRFPDMPAHSDVSDWLDAGGKVADLPGLAQPLTSQNDTADKEDMEGRSSNQDEKTPLTYEDALLEIARLRAQLAQANSEIATLRKSTARMNQKLRWINDVHEIPAERLSPAEKCAIVTTLREIDWKDPEKSRQDAEGYTPVYLNVLGEKTGTSPATYGKNLARLAGAGVFHVKTEMVNTDTGREKRYYVAPGPKIDRPHEWVSPDGLRKHGGKRQGAGRKPSICHACGSDQIEQHTIVQTLKRTIIETLCKDCGTIDKNQSDEMLSEQVIAEGSIQDEKILEPQERLPLHDTHHHDNSLPYMIGRQVAQTPPQSELAEASTEGQINLNTSVASVLVHPNDPVNTFSRRVQAYQQSGLNFIEATRRVEAENRRWWELHRGTAIQEVG